MEAKEVRGDSGALRSTHQLSFYPSSGSRVVLPFSSVRVEMNWTRPKCGFREPAEMSPFHPFSPQFRHTCVLIYVCLGMCLIAPVARICRKGR